MNFLNTIMFASIIFAASSHASEFIEFEEPKISDYLATDYKYLGEYGVKKFGSKILVPYKRIDPVPLEHFGATYYFFTSAIQGSCSVPGEAVQVIDPEISEIMAIRAKSDSYLKAIVHIYFGCGNTYVNRGGNKIYPAKVLALFSKNLSDVNIIHLCRFEGTQNLNLNELINPDAQQIRLRGCNQPPIFKDGVLHHSIYYSVGLLLNKQCYWDKDANHLKGICYKQNK